MAPEGSKLAWKQLSFSTSSSPTAPQGKGDAADGKSTAFGYVEIDPYEQGRSPFANYSLLISAIVPRPIGFLSTRSEDGWCWVLCRMEHS